MPVTCTSGMHLVHGCLGAGDGLSWQLCLGTGLQHHQAVLLFNCCWRAGNQVPGTTVQNMQLKAECICQICFIKLLIRVSGLPAQRSRAVLSTQFLKLSIDPCRTNWLKKLTKQMPSNWADLGVFVCQFFQACNLMPR